MHAIGTLAPGGSLEAQLIKGPKSPARAVGIRIPKLGRIWFTKDEGDSRLLGNAHLVSRLEAKHFDNKGRLIKAYDFGSGLTTQVLANALASESLYSATTSPLGRLTATATSYMASGTGTTAAAASDWTLQTSVSPTTAISTSTVAASADNTTITLVGTLAYTGTYAITEWGYFNQSSIAAVSGNSNTSTDTFTSTTATPGTSPAWTTNAEIGYIVVVGATPTNVSSPVIGVITGNSATAATVQSWFNATSGGGVATTPSTNTAMALYPIMGDHKVFSAINVVSGDSISFSYVLTCSSGG